MVFFILAKERKKGGGNIKWCMNIAVKAWFFVIITFGKHTFRWRQYYLKNRIIFKKKKKNQRDKGQPHLSSILSVYSKSSWKTIPHIYYTVEVKHIYLLLYCRIIETLFITLEKRSCGLYLYIIKIQAALAHSNSWRETDNLYTQFPPMLWGLYHWCFSSIFWRILYCKVAGAQSRGVSPEIIRN